MKTIINFAPTGMVHKKSDNPNLPVTIEEIVEEVRQAYQIGITIVHLHARNANQNPTNYPNIYSEIINKICTFAPDLVICVSTSGRVNPDFDTRSQVLNLFSTSKADIASLTLSSMNFIESVSINTPTTIKSLASKMLKNNIIPELEIFDLGMINYMKYLIKKDFLPQKNYINILLGNISGLQANEKHLEFAFSELPTDSIVSLAGLGRYQYEAIRLALKYNLGVRIGLEDNLYLEDTINHSSNIEQLNSLHSLLLSNNKTFMSSNEFKSILHF